MFKSILKRSIASAVAAGTVIAMASLTAPAQVSGAPAIENMGCKSKYPSKVSTTTDVSVEKQFQEYGDSNSATANVSSGVGTPEGWVKFSTGGWKSWKRLSGGSASTSLPKLSPGKTHPVYAKFYPTCKGNDYRFKRSSDVAYVSVMKIATSVGNVWAPNREVGQKPKVGAIITSESWRPYGYAQVTITNGDATQTRTVKLKRSRGNAAYVKTYFSRVYRPGIWTATVEYVGNRHFEGSSNSTTFQVGDDS